MFIILNDDHDDNDGCGGGGANYCVSVYICVRVIFVYILDVRCK